MTNKLKILEKIIFGIIAIAVLYYLVMIIRGCERAIDEITTTVEEREDRTWGEPKPMQIRRRIVGQDALSRLEITIPPCLDTVRLRIPGGEEVFGLPETAQMQVVKIPPAIIRLHPSFHICGLTDFLRFGVGLKVRLVEVWRFGACGYITTVGPGIGIDFQVISNISVGTMRGMTKWYAEVSIKI